MVECISKVLEATIVISSGSAPAEFLKPCTLDAYPMLIRSPFERIRVCLSGFKLIALLGILCAKALDVPYVNDGALRQRKF